MDPTPIPLDDFISENWQTFAAFEAEAEKQLTTLSRELPAGCYDKLRNELLKFVLLSGIGGKVRIRTVVDSSVIIGDVLRVASGKQSTTERILSSEFMEFVGPPEMLTEVERNVREKIGDRPNLDPILSYAGRLVSHIDVISPSSQSALARAQSLLSHHAKDVPFLATYFEVEADAIVSKEMKTFDLPGVCKWNLGRTVEIVVAYESGSLALVISSTIINELFKAFESLAMIVLKAVEEALKVIANLLNDIAKGVADAISKLPDWAKTVILTAGIGAIVATLLVEEFRNRVTQALQTMGTTLSSVVERLVSTVNAIWQSIKNILVLVWNAALPVTARAVVVGGVLLRRIHNLLVLSQSFNGTQSRTGGM